MLDGIYHINRIIGQVGFILPAAHRFFFLSWGPGGRQNPLIYQNLSAMFVVVKHPLAGRAPNLSLGQVPWVQAQAAQALRSKLMEETSQTQMKRMCWEGVCMNIYI